MGNLEYLIKANATPFDSFIEGIKGEITELRDSWELDCYHDEADALNKAVQIIDKHMGKENG